MNILARLSHFVISLRHLQRNLTPLSLAVAMQAGYQVGQPFQAMTSAIWEV